jgi:hypothetical protein
LLLLLSFSNLTFAQQQPASCDPLTIKERIPANPVNDIEVKRTGQGPHWVEYKLEVDREKLNPIYIDPKGFLKASTLHFSVGGENCPALIAAVQVYTNRGWQNLRLAGNNEFSSNYFGRTFTVDRVRVALNLFLLQKAYCDVSTEILIYEPNPIFGHPGHPFPRC